jgi:hypothetical protein
MSKGKKRKWLKENGAWLFDIWIGIGELAFYGLKLLMKIFD